MNFKRQIVQFVLDFLMSNFWVPDSSLLHDAGDIVSLQSLMILIYLRMISIYNNNIIFHGVIKIYTAARYYYYYYTNIRAIVFFGKVYWFWGIYFSRIDKYYVFPQKQNLTVHYIFINVSKKNMSTCWISLRWKKNFQTQWIKLLQKSFVYSNSGMSV